MTQDEIVKLAREAGAMFEHMAWVERDLAPVFERFAALVAAAERQRRQLTDEEISDLWHESGEQPFKFARMLLK